MSSSKQQRIVDTATAEVNWSALASLSDEDIARLWKEDADASWPSQNELAEFRRVNVGQPTKPEAAE